jgi:glycosyltransferase involved in cell wall biosynthesis
MKLLVLEVNYMLNGQPIRTSGVDYYRLIQPSLALKRHTDWTIEIRKDPFNGHPEKNWEEIAKNWDVIWTNYNIDSPAGYIQMRYFTMKYGKKLVTDLDDNLFELDEANPVYQRIHKGSEDYDKITSILRDVPYVTCSNNYLKDKIFEYTYRPLSTIQVFDNNMDLALMNPVKKKTDKIVLFYAGSHTHLLDVNHPEFIKGLDRIMSEYPQVHIHMMGMFSTRMIVKYGARHKFIDGDADYYKFVNKWKEAISEADIGLIPLYPTKFSKGKTAVKFYEYSTAKIPTVASNVRQYRKEITNGINGFLCETADDWYRNIKSLIEDEKLRQKIGSNAYKYIEENKNIDKNWIKYKEYFEKI